MDKFTSAYGLKELPKYNLSREPGTDELPSWGGWRTDANRAPPEIGERVCITFNGFGPGVVLGYFREAGYIGVEVKCDNRPKWHIEQNGDDHPHPLVFGPEIREVNEVTA